jgi:subtilase family serine protease
MTQSTRRSLESLSLAGLLVLLGSQALAQTDASLEPGQVLDIPSNSVVIPSSNIAKPEDRGVASHTNVRFIAPQYLVPRNANAEPLTPSPLVGPPFSGYGYETPGSLACLYGLVSPTTGCNPNTALTVPTSGSKAVAIVDAYHYATAHSDLQTYSTQFGLPAPNLKVFYATSTGSCAGPQPGTNAGWEIEEALDISMAHAMAPQAAIYLVEAQSNSNSDLLGAVKCANAQLIALAGGDLSMSWGGPEFTGETVNDATYFSTANVVYFASSGDSPGVSWPSVSSKVVSAGGTSISRAIPSFNFEHYASWADGGGGPSAYYAKPTYQNAVPGITGTKRVSPDIAADANPKTGVWVYDSNPVYGIGWYVIGGTSVASPLLAGVVNSQGHFRANTAAELSALYAAKIASATADFGIPTTGYCGPYASYTVNQFWNYCVGVGTVKEPATPLTQSAE